MSETSFTLTQFLRAGFDPVAEIDRLRSEEPVSRLQVPGEGTIWLITRYEDVRTVLGNSTVFSNDFHALAEASDGLLTAGQDPGGLGFTDPPDHTRLRRILTPEFTVRRLRRLAPRIEQIVSEHLDVMEAAGPPADLVQAFAVPIPSLVVGELLGVPSDERDTFQGLCRDQFDLSGDPFATLNAINDAVDYMEGLVVRERKDPGDGLLGMILREHGDDVGDRELAGLAHGLLTGGHDTTASMLALGALLLMERPEHAARVRNGDVNEIVEELLRYMSVVQVAFPRVAREDTVVGGRPIAAGDAVLCSFAAANRDPAMGEDMNGFDPSRPAPAHLAFGHGIHHCVGAQLGRMELRTAFPALLRRFPTLRPAVPFEEIPFREISIVYGVKSLPVTW